MKAPNPKTKNKGLKPTDSPSDKLGLDESTWTFRFMCDGRRYYLYKREHTRSAIWHLRCNIKGVEIRRSLDTHVAEVAVVRAIADHIRPARSGKLKEAVEKKMRSTFANLGTLEDTYSQICVGKISPYTLRNNINSFRLVVRRGMDNESLSVESHRALSSAVLTGKLVADFEDWMARDAVREGRDLESNKRSVAGYLRFARSLFKQTALPRYGELGVDLPDMKPFLTRRVEKAARLSRSAPDDELLKRTHQAVGELQREDAPAFIAWLLGNCTLRRGEIAQMKWDWLTVNNGQPAIMIPKEIAKSGAARSVSIEPQVVDALNKFHVEHRSAGRDTAEEQFVIPSPRIGQGKEGSRFRGQNVFKRVNAWMRKLGWTTNHTLHEMRALGLTAIADDHGDSVAQAVAGHQDVRTTVQSYIGRRPTHAVVCKLPFNINSK